MREVAFRLLAAMVGFAATVLILVIAAAVGAVRG